MLRAVGVAVLAGLLAGCDAVRLAPQVIEADGESHLACTGLVWVTKSSGVFSDTTTFKVSFTDSGNMDHTIWGVTKVSINDPPEYEVAPYPPFLPDPKVAVDIEGKPYVDGRTYTWGDGSKAELVDGKWKPALVRDACG